MDLQTYERNNYKRQYEQLIVENSLLEKKVKEIELQIKEMEEKGKGRNEKNRGKLRGIPRESKATKPTT